MTERNYFDFAEDAQLEALRRRSSSNAEAGPRPIKQELVPGRRALLIGIAIAVLAILLGFQFQHSNRASQPIAEAAASSVLTPTLPAVHPMTDGHVLASVALEAGSYPPELKATDSVVVIVTPHPDSTADVHALDGTAVVRSVAKAIEGTSKVVVTLDIPHAMAVDIAGAQNIHLFITGHAS